MTSKSLWSIIISTILCCIGSVTPSVIYDIETMCNSAGAYDVDSGQVVYLRGGYANSPITVRECNFVLRATTGDNILSFEEPIINLECGVALDIVYGSYTKAYACDTLASGKFSTQTRDATVKLTLGTNMASRFGTFQLQISAGIKPVDASQNSASAWTVGIIVGTVVGICVFLLLICIIGVCMHKKMRQAKMNERMYATQDKGPLELDLPPNRNFGYTNNYNENSEASPLAKTKLLNGYDENRKESPNSKRRPDTLNIRSNYTKPVPAKDPRVQTTNKDYQDDGSDTYYNMDEDKIIQPNRPKTPVTPILSALQSNPKFRKSFNENERDAEDRAKRISYSTSNDSINHRPPLPKVPDSNTRQVNLKKNQSMRKATRPDSYVDWSSSTQGSEEMEDERPQNREGTERPKHTLRPNRKKSPEQERKQTNKVKDPRVNDLRDDEDERIGLFQKQASTRSSARSSKRSQRSPRLGKGSKGFGHRRTGSRGDDAISIGSRTDLESLPPLQRSSSKTSLYASRSSLYSRRRRAGSCADSMVSYAHDDIDFYRNSRRSHTDFDDEDDFGGYEKPISRNDRLRMSKSDHDLGRAMREISTQTLRETATQTGLEESVTVHTKRVVKRRPRSRSMSAMGTQTQKKEKKKRTKSKQDLAVTTDDELDETEVKPVVKPKPKPKPRKSLSTVDHAAQSDNEGLKKKKMKRRSKSDANIAKSFEDLTHESNDKAVPGPQVPQHMANSHTVPANLQGYGPPGTMVVPPPYTTLPHGAQPTQFVTSQGQPVMVQPVAMPYQGNPPGPVVPPQYPVVPRKPRKSNWETLMEMTDNQKTGMPADTESVVSSVFTSNPPPTYQPGQPAFYPYQQGYSQPHNHPVQQFQPPLPQQVQQPPPVQPPAQYPPSQGWTLQPGGGSDGSSSGTTGSGSSTSGMYVTQPQGLPSQGKSSWDKLTDMTNQQYKIAYTSEKNDRSESVV